MSEAIWERKPDAELEDLVLGISGYEATEMDAWLENEVKPELDKLEFIKPYIEHPFFEFFVEMVNIYNYHFLVKGESWRTSSMAYLLDRLTNQLEDMQNDPDRENYMANIGNYAAMIRLKEILEG